MMNISLLIFNVRDMDSLHAQDLLSTLDESLKGTPDGKKDKLHNDIMSQCNIDGNFDRQACQSIIQEISKLLPKDDPRYHQLEKYYNSVDIIKTQETVVTNALLSERIDRDLLPVKQFFEEEYDTNFS